MIPEVILHVLSGAPRLGSRMVQAEAKGSGFQAGRLLASMQAHARCLYQSTMRAALSLRNGRMECLSVGLSNLPALPLRFEACTRVTSLHAGASFEPKTATQS